MLFSRNERSSGNQPFYIMFVQFQGQPGLPGLNGKPGRAGKRVSDTSVILTLISGVAGKDEAPRHIWRSADC